MAAVGGRWGPGPGGRERRAAVRPAGPRLGVGPGSGWGARAGLAAHPSEPAPVLAGSWEEVGDPLLPPFPAFLS